MIVQSVWQKSFDFFDQKPAIVEPGDAQLTSSRLAPQVQG